MSKRLGKSETEDQPAEPDRPPSPPGDGGLSDEALEGLKRRRFEERVQRVLSAMRKERIDWRGVPFVTPDGRISVRVIPMEMDQQ